MGIKSVYKLNCHLTLSAYPCVLSKLLAYNVGEAKIVTSSVILQHLALLFFLSLFTNRVVNKGQNHNTLFCQKCAQSMLRVMIDVLTQLAKFQVTGVQS